VNAGESEYYGFEMDGQWRPRAPIELFASAAYVKTEFLDFVDGGNDFSGNEFRDAPEWTAAAGATYFFDNGIYLGGDVSYTSSSFLDAANTVENDSRFLTNVRVGYQSGDWEAFAYAKNLFDEDYAFGEQTAGGQTIVRAGDPLTAGIVVQARF
jgi:outer membrane receptor protein involved in Fe transport